MKFLLPTLALIGVFLLPTTHSQAADKYNHEQFEVCDKSRDGHLSQSEFSACWPWRGVAFEKLDRWGDGMLSPNDMDINRPHFSKNPKHAPPVKLGM